MLRGPKSPPIASIAVTLQVGASSTVRELVMGSRFDVGLAASESGLAFVARR